MHSQQRRSVTATAWLRLTATSRLKRSVYEPVGISTFVVPGTRPCAYQRPRPVYVCALRDTRTVNLTAFARCAFRVEEDCSDDATPPIETRFVRHCWHEGPALLTVLVPARLWQCLARSVPMHKSHYVEFRPMAETRSRRTLGHGSRRLIASEPRSPGPVNST